MDRAGYRLSWALRAALSGARWSPSASVPLVALLAACGGGSAEDSAGTATTTSSSAGAQTDGGSMTAGSTSSTSTTDPSGTMGVSMSSSATSETSAGETTGSTTVDPTTGTTGADCVNPETDCDGVCVNINTDPENCGVCGLACADGELCADGDCVLDCPEGQVQCGQSCVDINTDPAHCGECDLVCSENQVCEGASCVDLECVPLAEEACYGGPKGTQGVGVCAAGVQVCAEDGKSFGPCEGEVVPSAEDCSTPEDENCDGEVNEGCALESCMAYKQEDPDAADGQYLIDPDQEGPIEPFLVVCDMTLDGGGWTRFNWVQQDDYPAGEDPLGQALHECTVKDTLCRGRIPEGVAVSDLMIKDTSDNAHAMWTFNNSTISNAVLGALQDKTESCLVNQGAFQPYTSTSAEAYCGTGQEGGCDSFFYTSGSCKGVGSWGIHWDGDNAWCMAAFKMGATFGGCGNQGDQGFLNGCACDDEQGELYYR